MEYHLDPEDWAQWLCFARQGTTLRWVRAVSYAVLGVGAVSLATLCLMLPHLMHHHATSLVLFITVPALTLAILATAMLVVCTVGALLLGPLDSLVQTRRVRWLLRAGKLPAGRLRLAWSARGVWTCGSTSREVDWGTITQVTSDRGLVYLRRGRSKVVVVPRNALGEAADELILAWRKHIRQAAPPRPAPGPFDAPAAH